MNITSIGIIGLGSFGKLVASLIPPDTSIQVIGYDTQETTLGYGVQAELAIVATCDIVILAVPLSAYPEILQKLQKLLPLSSLLIDVCSVKIYPEQLIQTYLPEHTNILLTHPLFGPQTASVLKGKELVVTKSSGDLAHEVLAFCDSEFGLHITRITSEDHDKTMAQVHALTFFIADGLANMHLQEVPFSTPSYQMLTDLIQFQKNHSDDLFQTVQRGNPFSASLREQLLASLMRCDQAIKESEE